MKILGKFSTKQLVLGTLIVAGLAWFVYAQVILSVLAIVSVPLLDCRESDGGFNVLSAGCIAGNFTLQSNKTNITFEGTFCDSCTSNASNATLIEFVCGGSIAPQYNSLAGAFLVQCGPGTRCVSGRCV